MTPKDTEQRGCQLSLRLRTAREQARRIFNALEAGGVVCDWREPDVVRVAPVPLYNTFAEVFKFVQTLKNALS